MLGMAFLTFFLFLDATVKTALFGNVFADLFVAFYAQARLRGFIEFLVALFAILFFFCMAFDYITWRNHATESLMVKRHRKTKKQ
jgi:hypothetical protein